MDRRLAHAAAVAGFLALSGCSSAAPDTSTPALAVHLSSSSVSVAQGGLVILTAALQSSGVTGADSVVVDGLPSGVAGGLQRMPTVNGSAEPIGINASLGAPVGTYSLTVRAIDASGTTASAALTLHVLPNLESNVQSLAASQSALSITAGGPAASTAMVAGVSATYTDQVSLGLVWSGLSLNPTFSGVHMPNLTFNIAAAAGTAPGVYPIVVSASGADNIKRSVTVMVTVTP